ncbi:MAG: hypothetical protein RI897_3427 [Verrucomicrobiota bacterium]
MGCFVEPKGGERFGGPAPEVKVDLAGEIRFGGIDFDGADAPGTGEVNGHFDVGEASGSADEHDEIGGVAVEDVVELPDCGFGELFAEEHDGGTEDAAALFADEREIGGGVTEGLEQGVAVGGMVAFGAGQQVMASMEFDEVP